jgi:hypothetical protein
MVESCSVCNSRSQETQRALHVDSSMTVDDTVSQAIRQSTSIADATTTPSSDSSLPRFQMMPGTPEANIASSPCERACGTMSTASRRTDVGPLTMRTDGVVGRGGSADMMDLFNAIDTSVPVDSVHERRPTTEELLREILDSQDYYFQRVIRILHRIEWSRRR